MRPQRITRNARSKNGFASAPTPLFDLMAAEADPGYTEAFRSLRTNLYRALPGEHGKVVLVTGSSRGMGAAILEAFARAGAVCVVNYFDDPDGQNRRDADQIAQRLRGYNVPVHVLDADVRHYTSVESLMKRVVTQAGGAWWDVAVPETSGRDAVRQARIEYERLRRARWEGQ